MMFKSFTLISTISIFLALVEQFSGKVISISDGDTFTLLHEKEQIKVRLYGIDCPEKSQAFGQKAKKFTSDRIFGEKVTVISHGKDRYGRIIGEVILENGSSLNKELVKNGFAWWYRQYAPKDSALGLLEDSARIARIGLWADPDPVEPWNFRKGEPQSTSPSINIESGTGDDSVFLNVKSKKYHCRSCKYVNDCRNCVLVPFEKANREGESCGVCGGKCR